MNTLIKADKLSHNYGAKKTLDKVSFTLSKGEYISLLGPNGAGKTTLFSLLSNFIPVRSGQLEFFSDNKTLSHRQAIANIGFVFQQTTLDLDLTIAQNLHYHAALHGMSTDTAKERIHNELGRLDILDRIDDKVRSLNGGHKRRVEIARALLHQPNILLLDEPTVGLDYETRENLNQYIHHLCTEQGIAILCTTHLIDEVKDSDNILLLNEGKVCFQGLSNELLEQTESADLRSFFMKKNNLNQ